MCIVYYCCCRVVNAYWFIIRDINIGITVDNEMLPQDRSRKMFGLCVI